MLILKGDSGKSLVLDALINIYKNNCIGIVYESNSFNVNFGTYIIDTNECSIDELCEELPNLVEDIASERLDVFNPMVVVYTNFKEDEIIAIKNTVKKLEDEHCCGIGIVMCKE